MRVFLGGFFNGSAEVFSDDVSHCSILGFG